MTSLRPPPTDSAPALAGTAHLHRVPAGSPGGLVLPPNRVVDERPDALVVARPPSGPRFAAGTARLRTSATGTFVQLLSRRDRAVVGALTAGWLLAQLSFWTWWLEPDRVVTLPGLMVNSALLLYLAVLPAYFLMAANRLRGVRPDLPVPDVRVAFVVTKAPSEPWPTARATVQAMAAQFYPHAYDVWLCDEAPTDETLAWCHEHGIRVATRQSQPEYHQPHWPRRTRCKEGNLAWFYDHWGYHDYDVVVQLDCDHVPAPTYLSEMVRPFADPAVGYVAAPSVCDSNAADSWSARGRLYREASFHGPAQTGHQRGLAPSCIGSHYAVRTVALREAGGVGPELAEDFSTSFLLTSAGWTGAFAHRAEAHGEGPHTTAAMLTQEFQWSRSLSTLFYDLVPAHLGRLNWRLRLRYLFALSYYPAVVLTTVAGLSLPPIAAVTGVGWVRVDYVEFLVRWGAISIWVVALTLLLRRRGLLRPVDSPIISWETWLYVLTRWPYIAWGVLAATLQKVRPRVIGFRVTPKSREGLEPLPVRLLLPYLTITGALSGAGLVGELTTNAAGYVFLCLLGSLTYAVVSIALCALHALEAARATGTSVRHAVRSTVAVPLAWSIATLVPLGFAIASYPAYSSRVFGW